MFDPDFSSDRAGDFVAVTMGFDARGWVGAQMAVIVDDAGGDPFAGGVDRGGAFRSSEVCADRADLAPFDQHAAALDEAALAVKHGCIGDQRRAGGVGCIGGGKRIEDAGGLALVLISAA